jgi:hypothetical protein
MTTVLFKEKILSRVTRVIGTVRGWRGIDLSRPDKSAVLAQRRQRIREVHHPKTKQELRRALQQLKALRNTPRLIGQGTDKPRRAA